MAQAKALKQRSPEGDRQMKKLVEMLEAGIASVKAGKVVEAADVRRRIDEEFARRAAAQVAKKKRR
jgi:hypothetical protein